MEIKSYIDAKTGEMYWKFRVTKQSSIDPTIRLDWSRLGFKSKKEAAAAKKKLEREAERALFEKEEEGATWESLINEWEHSASNGDIFIRSVTLGTVGDYMSLLNNYTSDWFKLSIEQIDKASVWRLLDKVDREVSVSRRKKLRSAIDSVFNWGFLSGRIKGTKNLPTEGYTTTQRIEEKLPEILSISEIKSFLQAAFIYGHEWADIWSLALLTGMRSGELYALTWDHIDFDSELMFVHENWTNKEGIGPTKARYWRAIPLSKELKVFLEELKLKSKGGYEDKVWRWKDRSKRIKDFYTEKEFVLPRFQAWKDGRQSGILRSFLEGLGLPSVRFHTLRSCFATQLIKDGVAPAIIMKICGWRDLKTMQRYIRLAGIEVKGATEGLKLLPEKETMGRIYELFKG